MTVRRYSGVGMTEICSPAGIVAMPCSMMWARARIMASL